MRSRFTAPCPCSTSRLFTHINVVLSLRNLLQKPVFYHLWFFFAIVVIYLLSPLVQVKQVSGRMLLALMLVLGILANPNMVPVKAAGVEWLPLNLYINGDTFYYVMYGVLGRAIGTLDTDKKWLTALCAGLFITGVWVISRGTLHELRWRGDFGDTWYLYCGPAVFVCALAPADAGKKYAQYASAAVYCAYCAPFVRHLRISCADYSRAARQRTGADPLANVGYCLDIQRCAAG